MLVGEDAHDGENTDHVYADPLSDLLNDAGADSVEVKFAMSPE